MRLDQIPAFSTKVRKTSSSVFILCKDFQPSETKEDFPFEEKILKLSAEAYLSPNTVFITAEGARVCPLSFSLGGPWASGN